MKSILSFLNIWVIGGAVSVACILLFLSISVLWVTRSSPSLTDPVTAIVKITSVSSEFDSTTTPEPSNNPSDATQYPPSPPPGDLALGAYVQITGTSGEGLRLRDQPGLSSRVLLLGSEAEVFRIDGGPQEIDGYLWWYLVGPFDETRRGWAVANYLRVVQNP